MDRIKKTEGRMYLDDIQKKLAEESEYFHETIFDNHSINTLCLVSYQEELIQIWKTEARFRQGFVYDDKNIFIPTTFTIINGFDEDLYEEIKKLPNKVVIEDRKSFYQRKKLFLEKLKQKNQIEDYLRQKKSPILKNSTYLRINRSNFSDEIIDKHNKFNNYGIPPKLVVIAKKSLRRVRLSDLIVLSHMGWDIIYLNPQGGGSLDVEGINKDAVNIFRFKQSKDIDKSYFIKESIFKKPWLYNTILALVIIYLTISHSFIWALPLLILGIFFNVIYFIIKKVIDFLGL